MSRKMDPNLQLTAPSGLAATSVPPRILRLKEVCKMVGLGRSFVYRLQTENRPWPKATISRTPENFADAYIAQRLSRHSDAGDENLSLSF